MNPATTGLGKAGQVLAKLFEQIEQDPDNWPLVPTDQFPEGSEERHLLEQFAGVLARIKERAGTATGDVLPYEDGQDFAEQERYRTVFEATSDGLVINDKDGIAVEVNHAFCDMHGYSREEMIGLNLAKLHPPGSQPVYWEYLETAESGRVFMTQAEHIHQRKDGTQFYVEVRGSQFNYKGQPHILGVVRDVTDRVRAYETLEQRVEERTRELLTLLDVAGKITSTLELQPLMVQILDQVKVVTD